MTLSAIDDHLRIVVKPALAEYWDAEGKLSAAIAGGDQTEVIRAREAVIRKARTAAIELHQFADLVQHEPDPRFSPPCQDVEDVRRRVEINCRSLRSQVPISDISLLRGVAEAFKHHTLGNKQLPVTGTGDIEPAAMGFGEGGYGEGKCSGEQMIVTQKDGRRRALLAVLQNAYDAWLTTLSLPQPPLIDFS